MGTQVLQPIVATSEVAARVDFTHGRAHAGQWLTTTRARPREVSQKCTVERLVQLDSAAPSGVVPFQIATTDSPTSIEDPLSETNLLRTRVGLRPRRGKRRRAPARMRPPEKGDPRP